VAAGAAVTGFSRALGAGNGAQACGLLTTAAQAAFVRRVQALGPTRDCPAAIKRVHDAAGSQVSAAFSLATVSDVRVTGNSATALLTASGHSTLVRVAKQDGRWKLTGVPGL
jgi:hypothetical protein